LTQSSFRNAVSGKQPAIASWLANLLKPFAPLATPRKTSSLPPRSTPLRSKNLSGPIPRNGFGSTAAGKRDHPANRAFIRGQRLAELRPPIVVAFSSLQVSAGSLPAY